MMSSPVGGKNQRTPALQEEWNKQKSTQGGSKDPILAQDILGCLQFLENEMVDDPATSKEAQKINSRVQSPPQKQPIAPLAFDSVPRSNYNSVMSSTSSYSHVKSLQGLDQQDDDTLVAKMYDLYEKLKQKSSTQSRPAVLEVAEGDDDDEEENDIEIEDDFADDLQNFPGQNQIAEESYFDFEQDRLRRQQIVEGFLQRTQEHQEKRAKRIEEKRQNQIDNFKRNQEAIWQNKSRQKTGTEDEQSEQQHITPKKQRQPVEELLPTREIQLQQELKECTFKPSINPVSISLITQKHRSPEEFYHDMINWKNQKEEAILEAQCHGEEQQRIAEALLFTNREQTHGNAGAQKAARNLTSPSFLERLDSDIQKRALKKMELQVKCAPSFKPMIYENFRPQNLIMQMQEEKSMYRLTKANQESEPQAKPSQDRNNSTQRGGEENNRNLPVGGSGASKHNKNVKSSTSKGNLNLSYSQTLKKSQISSNPAAAPLSVEKQNNSSIGKIMSTPAKATKNVASISVSQFKPKDDSTSKLNYSNLSPKDSFKSFLQNNISQLKSSLNPTTISNRSHTHQNAF